MMPGMTGLEVAGLLKDHPSTARIPILVLTSKKISADDRRELQSKVAACVQKGKSARISSWRRFGGCEELLLRTRTLV
jgi:CheY-like chemotaxis protein